MWSQAPSPTLRRLVVFALLTFALTLAASGCYYNFSGKKNTLGNAAAKTAQGYIGAPYVYGGRSPKGFDCSGLALYVYRQHGVTLPPTSWKQADYGKRVKKRELRPGDLVFFSSSKGRVDHVGIYIGNGKFVHAPGRGKHVTTADLGIKYYTEHYMMARRVSK